MKNCEHCGCLFTGGRPSRVFCGPSCKGKAKHARRKAGLSSPRRATTRPRPAEPAWVELEAAIELAVTLGESRGWSTKVVRDVQDGLVELFAACGQPPIPLSLIRANSAANRSARRTAEVLAELELLEDDLTPSIHLWIERRCAELPAFGPDIRAWLLLLCDGDARTRPRSRATLYVYFGKVRPFLLHWAVRYDHLREVTRADLDELLDTMTGHLRRNAITALKSLFRFAKKRRLVFTDPALGLCVGRDLNRQILPLRAEEIQQIELTAVTPLQRLAVALAAFHAARAKQIREITLDDLDLETRHITIAGNRQRFGEPTLHILLAWLEFRRATWPRTANPHLIISLHTALGLEPVSHYFLKKHLLLRGVHLERIRGDRILHEALATGADPLHLISVFDLHPSTAIGYANAARTLLEDPLGDRALLALQ